MKTKKCPHCKKVKDISNFSKDKNRKNKHNSWCKSCISDWYKEHMKKNPDIERKRYESALKWRKENEPKIRRKSFSVITNGKKIQCAKYKEWHCCHGQTDLRFLQLDHLKGGGYRERKKDKKSSLNFYYWIIKNPIKARKKLQVLCSNANWIKKFENKEVAKIRKLPTVSNAISRYKGKASAIKRNYV